MTIPEPESPERPLEPDEPVDPEQKPIPEKDRSTVEDYHPDDPDPEATLDPPADEGGILDAEEAYPLQDPL
ncbi:hypothetical protein FHP29_05885 [Nocardioides albidus]|uniref:Uncharacterized protein n=1 Tax=Nocardioides albidus TaxID=1517589 RepID=A0A5C4W7S6_9ACTN|nr:hypothetical protein [Nocardioides albidus]TNM44231.1 hypothetical protein FHP29_05885 [Nocardioides albidus]